MKNNEVIPRHDLANNVTQALTDVPATALLGARQVGKTTLARKLAAEWQGDTHLFDLETETGIAALSATPELVLSGLRGLVVIDEIQRLPHIFTILRPLLDRNPLPARFLLLGSASPNMIKGVSESLAGRIRFVTVPGLSISEVGAHNQDKLWFRGGFPRSFLASNDKNSSQWQRDFIKTFIERDIPQIGIQIPPETIRRFWSMLAHFHGQIWNGEELARSMGVSAKTVRHYLDILAGMYLVRVLPPWFENLGKRQIKSPKIYIRDTGLLHRFLNITSMKILQAHPKYGASWEGFAMEQILSCADTFSAYFWRTQKGAELDLLLEHDGKRFGFEFKCADAPKLTKSMRIAISDLRLERLCVIYPGQESYPIHEKADVMPLPVAKQLIDELYA